jgi:hypothetical protein
VIADSINPRPVTREAWLDVARRAGVPALEIEIVCSDGTSTAAEGGSIEVRGRSTWGMGLRVTTDRGMEIT